MKTILFLTLIYICMIVPVNAEQRFFSSLYDVPVMSTLEPLSELSYNYDTAEGKIAHAAAVYEGKDPHYVYVFYNRVLLQFGWRDLGNNSYVREGEILALSHELLDNIWLFHFSMSPAPEKS
ncbi:MAG: hypothetical protein HRT94_05320 [Alphaproteobacteria bacterium]|nr:hypothetical protein [Alphaproteobacteria bacterium]